MTVLRQSGSWLRQPGNLQRLGRGLLVLVFLWLAGRYWHPYYGFTKFIQFDASDAAVMLPELRAAPVYVHRNSGGYDGTAYAQMAVHPAVRAPALAAAIDNLPYRARRILLSWAAWILGAGDPVRTVHAYAALNVAVWLGLAWLLHRLFPPPGWRPFLAWTGVLFSAGALHSVRFALTDLAALTLLVAALRSAERARPTAVAGLLGAAGLVRETALLGAVALWPEDWRKISGATLGRLVLAALPLGLWLLYLRAQGDPMAPGQGNFSWPLAAWAGKLAAAVTALRYEPETLLAVTTLLAFIAVTVQLVYVAVYPQPRSLWWRLGLVYGILLLCLGPAVWEGDPGAATRVLLPLALAFNVLAVRRAAGAPWLFAGNLAVFSGVFILWLVPADTRELASGRGGPGAYVVKTDERWYDAERGRSRVWAWCARAGAIELDFWPHTDGTVTVQLELRGITPRPLEIRQGGRLLWRGEIGARLQAIDLPALTLTQGRAQLELASPADPVREGPEATARRLGFAVYAVRVKGK
jgi:hypothetical protein